MPQGGRDGLSDKVGLGQLRLNPALFHRPTTGNLIPEGVRTALYKGEIPKFAKLPFKVELPKIFISRGKACY